MRLSRKQFTLTSILALSLLAGGIIALIPGEDPMLAEIEAYATPKGKITAELRRQLADIRGKKSVNVPNKEGYTPIMNAARSGNIDAVDYLLVKGARLRRVGPGQQTAAAMAANDEIRQLLEACELAERKPGDQEKEQMRQNLRNARINPDDLNQALFDAVSSWSGDSVRLTAQVLALGGNANAINPQGRHILQHRHQNPGSMILLLRQGSNPDAAKDSQGASHAILNTINRNPRFVRSLLAANASVKGANALAKAAGRGNAEWVEQFLERGADPNGVADNGKTVLEHAVQGLGNPSGIDELAGIPRCVQMLLEAGAKTEYKQKDGTLRSPISPGGMSILPECIRLLVDAGAKVNALNSRGANYAQIAAYKKATPENVKLLKDIIKAGADLKQVDAKGETFLFYALPSMCALPVTDPVEDIRNEALDMLEELLDIVTDAHPDPGALDRNGNTALHLAVIRRGTADDRVVEYLLRMGVNPAVRNKFGRTALEAMLKNPCGPRSKYVARLLARKGPLPTDPGLQLVLAAMMDDTATIRKLLEAKPDEDTLAVALGCVQNAGAADLLLRAGAPAYHENIAYMVRHGNPDVVRIFANHNRLRNLEGHWESVKTKAMAKAFVEAGLRPNSPYDIANERVLKYLLSLPDFNPNGVAFNMNHWRDNEAMLTCMVSNGRSKMTRMLLKHGVAVNGYKVSPLAVAQDAEIAEMLMEHGTDLTWKSATGDTLLSLRKNELRKLARDYQDSPTNEELEQFRAHFAIAELLEDAGVSDIHPDKEEIKKSLQNPYSEEEFETVQFVTPDWSGSVRISEKAMVLARSSGNTDTANILSMGPDRIKFKWDRWGYGYVVRKADGRYYETFDESFYHDFKKNPAKVPHIYVDFVNEEEKGARLYMHPDYEYAVRGDNMVGGRILSVRRGYNGASIRIKWDKGEESTFVNVHGKMHILTAASAKKVLTSYNPPISFKEVVLVGQGWQDNLRISTDFMVAARCCGTQDTAQVHQFDERRITLKWDRWSEESFIRQADGKYYKDSSSQPEAQFIRDQIREGTPAVSVKNYQFEGNEWRDTVTISFMHKVAVRKGGRKDAAKVIRFNKGKITLKWDDYGEETFERQSDGVYRIAR